MISPLNTFDFLDRAAKLYPRRVAVVDGTLRFTYSDLLKRSLSLNGRLEALGLHRGDVISVLDYNTHHMLELYFGLTKSGIVINPLNFRYSPEDLLYMLNIAESKALVLHEDFLPLLEKIRARLKSLKHIILIQESSYSHEEYPVYEEMMHEGKSASSTDEYDENDTAEILFTSGSTSKPKAVSLTHRNLYLNALYTIISYQMTEEDNLLHVVPLFHANGGGTPQTITAVGGKHVMLRKVESDEMLRLIETEHVTMFVAVPTVLNRFLSHPDFESFDTSSLRRIIVVGTAASIELMRETESKIPGCECLSAYGMTETGPLVALARPKLEERSLPFQDQLKFKTRTGYEVMGVDVKVDAKEGLEEGEILVKGNSIFNGYYQDERATNETIIEGWFHTGDWGRAYPDGWLAVVDRVKDMIKSGGENISSTEIEEVLSAHPSVAEAAVISIPDEQWGEIPKAFVVTRPDKTTTELELKDFCRSKMAHFKIPKSIELLDSLPRTPTGKVSKNELRRAYWSGSEKKIN